MSKIIGYKIFNPATGLYSKGSTYNQWSKQGKVWNSTSALKSHLTSIYNDSCCGGLQRYSECVVVTLIEAERVPFEEFAVDYYNKMLAK